MKKKILSLMLIAGMSFGVLTGCGDKTTTPETEVATEVETEAVDETEAEVENPEDLPLQEVPVDETEAVEETETEEVAEADFFAENGLTVVAPADVTSYNGRVSGTDTVRNISCTVEMTETSPTTTEFVWTIDNWGIAEVVDWGIGLYDRATGTNMNADAYKTGDTATGEAYAVPLPNGETIDVSYEFEFSQDEKSVTHVKYTAVYPEGYNNIVMAIYGRGAKESNATWGTNIADDMANGAIPADATFIAIQ